MLYVKLINLNGTTDMLDRTVNDWIDTAHSKYTGFTVVSISIQHLSYVARDEFEGIAVIEYRNDMVVEDV